MKVCRSLFALALAVCLCLSLLPASLAAGYYQLGDVMDDFTAVLADGTTVTLSGLLAEHDAVFINFWATWCPPCCREFPAMEAAFAKYQDSVAIVALSIEPTDTDTAIAQFKANNSLSLLPMGQDVNGLENRFNFNAIPTSVLVDRTGTIVWMESGSITQAKEFERLFSAVTGSDYTGFVKPDRLDGVPDLRAFSGTHSALVPLDARSVVIEDTVPMGQTSIYEQLFDDIPAYVAGSTPARFKVQVGSDLDLHNVVFLSDYAGELIYLDGAVPAEEGDGYVFETGLSTNADGGQSFNCIYLVPDIVNDSNFSQMAVVFASEADLDFFCQMLVPAALHCMPLTWHYEETAGTVLITDMEGAPVPGVMVQLCDSEACTVLVTDENGAVTMPGAGGWEVHLLSLPEGYTADAAQTWTLTGGGKVRICLAR